MRIPALLLCLAAAVSGQSTDAPAYTEPRSSRRKARRRPGSRMTLEEKVLQMQNSAPRHPAAGHSGLRLVERSAARRGARRARRRCSRRPSAWRPPSIPDLMHRIADTISTEARAKYNEAIRNNNHGRYFGLTFWSPNINIFRDPRWGRGQETYGEDPFLTGAHGRGLHQGHAGRRPALLQSRSPPPSITPCTAARNPTRHQFDVQPSERDLNDTYLPAFRAAIVEGKADSVMCAYNAWMACPPAPTPICWRNDLRGDWGFQGYVVSDCGAITRYLPRPQIQGRRPPRLRRPP